MRFTELLTAEFQKPRWRDALTAECRDPLVRAAVRKLAARELAEAVGVRTPRLLAVRDSLHGLDWSRLPTRYVIKSDRMAGCHGVLAMDGLYDALHGCARTLEEITARTDLWERPLLIEEAVVGCDNQYPPRDYKVWCFGGHVELIQVCERVGHCTWNPLCGWYDRHWQPYPTAIDHPPLSSVPQPRYLEHMLEAASSLGQLFSSLIPFMRVDFYIDCDGPVFGEFCCDPHGRRNYIEAADQRLGQVWSEQEAP